MDSFYWSVVYHDGKFLSEHDRNECSQEHPRETGHGWACVDRSGVANIRLHDPMTDSVVTFSAVPIGGYPVFFRRRRHEIDLGSGTIGEVMTTHVFGWEQNVEGRMNRVLVAVRPDGTILLTTDSESI